MEWTPRQLEALYANVYRRRMECPSCGGGLKLIPSRELDAFGDVECRTCDARHFVAVANDH